MKKIRKLIALFVSGIFIMSGIYSSRIYAEEPVAYATPEEWNWTFEYTGTEQVFTAPYSGIYKFEVYGAQGGSTNSKEGGKGGKVTAEIRLSRNEEIIIYVGGTDGFNGGGTGTVSSGGGATDIRQGGNGLSNRILVAAGGGGANNTYSGGNGGVTSTTNISNKGESSKEGAGGGGGYKGGASGIEHIVLHTHTAYGGSCYVPEYHEHVGNESVYGGCYITEQFKTMLVTHNWCVTERGETTNFSGEVVEGEGTTHYISTAYKVKDEHGHTGELYWCYFATGERAHMKDTWEFKSGDYGNASGILADEPLDFTFSTGKDESVAYYVLGCGLNTDSITSYHFSCDKIYDEYNVKQSAGGTNYYDADKCKNAISKAGVKTGNGACSIKINTLYNLYYDGVESLNVYYDGIKVKKIYYKGKLIYLE